MHVKRRDSDCVSRQSLLRPSLGAWSPELIRLGFRIVDALTAPNSALRLQLDSLYLQLAMQLWSWGDLAADPARLRERLSAKSLRSVVDYLQGNLGQDVSLQDLAALRD